MDLIFERFLDQYYSSLSPQQIQVFDQLLDETDLDIMDWILMRTEPDKNEYVELLNMFRQFRPDN